MGQTWEEKKRAQIEDLLALLPKNEGKQLMAVPGLYYGGGCSYMACRGLMMGPISDVLLITHGPTGCGCFAGINGRREQNPGKKASHDGRCFSTNMRDADIIFGGEEKLLNAIAEAVEMFHPKAVAICATCPIGLIGDDIEQVAKTAAERFGIPILPLSCEGFKAGSGGWLLGGKMIEQHWLGTAEKKHGPFSVHYMSESYCGRNKQETDRLFDMLGYDIVCSMMGSTTYEELCAGHSARLIVLESGKAIDEVPKWISETYGTGFFRVDFTGISNIIDSLRRMADFFHDEGLAERTESVIAQELERIEKPWMAYRQRFSGMTAALFEDIFRSDHFSALSADLGFEVVTISQDYTKEELTNENFTLHVSQARLAGIHTRFSPAFMRGGRAYFQLTRRQVWEFLRELKPDICFAGIAEQFGYNDAPIRSELFTSEERGVEYGGFHGFLRYAADLEMAAFMSHWVTDLPDWAKIAGEAYVI